MPLSDDLRTSPCPPHFENLEERLLLTTLSGGEVFLYLNTDGEAVRVSLHGEPTDHVELLAWDEDEGGMVDLVGLRGVMEDDGVVTVDFNNPVEWPDGGNILEEDEDGVIQGWQEYRPETEDQEAIRGAATEIWSIYVANCSPDTVLTISTLANEFADEVDEETGEVDVESWELWNVTTWGSGSTPALGTTSGGIGEPAREVFAPDGSGGVLVGGIRIMQTDPEQGNEIVFRAVQNDEATTQGAHGVFPGGSIHPGIQVGDDADTFGRIMIAGTVAGKASTPYSFDTMYMGFLYGNVEVQENLGDLIMRRGGGAVRTGGAGISDDRGDYLQPENGSLIDVYGIARLVESRGGEVLGVGPNETQDIGTTLFSAVQVRNDPTIDLPDDEPTVYELEFSTDESQWDDDDAHDRKLAWIYGFLTDDPASEQDFNNDTPDRAQFISHPTGNFTLVGSLDDIWEIYTNPLRFPDNWEAPSPNPDGLTYWQDWYAIPLFAGQTLVMEGVFSELMTFVRLYDRDGNWMDSYGYESVEDEGVGSRGATPKPMRFTAPAAGVYYLCVLASDEDSAGNYALTFTNAGTPALGALSVVGHYGAGLLDSRTSLLTADATVAADYNGIGAVSVTSNSYNAMINTYRGGDLVAFQAGEVGTTIDNDYQTNYVVSEGNVGGVASTLGHLDASIEAGAFSGAYNHNAHIQNIYAATDYIYLNSISASGSIGVVEVGGVLGSRGPEVVIRSISFQVNSDGIGEPGHIDLFDVGGAWGAPLINTGSNGNVGYISVGGDIHSTRADWSGLVQPVVVADGSANTIYDDGGGQIRIAATPIPVLDAQGFQTFDAQGNPITYRAPYEYTLIGINDNYDGGVGGVIANLTAYGPMTLTVTGDVDISELDVHWMGTDPNRPTDVTINVNGSGATGIYYLHDERFPDSGATPPTGNYDNLTLNMDGHLVSGHLAFTNVAEMRIGGSLGPLAGTTGAWLHGHDDAPFVDDADIDVEPRYGWFHGKVNGLAVGWLDNADQQGNPVTDLRSLRVDGSIGDIRVRGSIGTVRANADDITPAGDWDGIIGLIWSDSRLDKVYVGDGLADDGGGEKARAALMSTGFIGLVSIEGPYYTVEPSPSADLEEQLAGAMAFGQLDGSIIGSSNGFGNVWDGSGNDVLDAFGNPVTRSFDAVDRVVGTNGAVLTANVLGFELDSFMANKATFTWTGGVGTVDFSGPGAEITGSEISGLWVRRISTSADSNGISYAHVSGNMPFDNRATVLGQILAGGPGLRDSTISLTGGDINRIEGVGPVADFTFNRIIGPADLRYLGFRDIDTNGIHLPGVIRTIHATRDMRDNDVGSGSDYGFYVGAIDTLTVGGDFVSNDLHIASELTARIGGSMISSAITLYGPFSRLHSLIVSGDIGGQVKAAGTIGSIISQHGQISADIITSNDKGDIDRLEAAQGFAGDITVGGSLGRIVSHTSLGLNPATNNGVTQYVSVGGDLGRIEVIGTRTTPAHLYADFAVAGNVDSIDVEGTLYSNIVVNGDLGRLDLEGALGGTLGGGVGDRGSLIIFGTIGRMRFNTGSDLVADLTIGGSIENIRMRDADIRGNIESRFGSIERVSVRDGSIQGALTGRSIGRVEVRGGSITGDVTTTAGDLDGLRVSDGNLDANVTAAGRIDRIDVINGNATSGHTISATQGIDTIRIRGGDLDADVTSGGWIDRIDVNGGSDLTGAINAALGIDRLDVSGVISNTTIRAGGPIERLSAENLTNSIISAAWYIDRLDVRGDMTNSAVYAGYDVGDDGAVGGGDDNPLNGGVVHCGTIDRIRIRGAFNGSVVMGGVDPTDNSEADGVSRIERMDVGAFLNPGSSQVRADTVVDEDFAAEATAAGVTVSYGVTSTPDTSGADYVFGPNTAAGREITVGAITLRLTDGTGYYDVDTNELFLVGTTDRSSLDLDNEGPAATISVETADDSGLRSLRLRGNLTLGDVDIDGEVRTLDADFVANGATWNLPGGIHGANLQGLTSATVTAGCVRTWRMDGAFVSGSFTADAIRQFRVDGKLGANVTAALGGIRTVRIDGNQTGDLMARDTVRRLDVDGALSGDVTVTHGDLDGLQVYGDFSGAVNVERGETRTVQIRYGDFTSHAVLRTGRELRRFDVRSGDMDGLLSVGGDLRNLNVRRGEFAGRAWSAGSIRTVRVGSINEGLISASGDICRVRVDTNMFGGWIMAGFDPGDAGYDAAHGGEDANVKIDAFTDAGDRTAENADQATAGRIDRVDIGGDMGRTYNNVLRRYMYAGGTIAAGIDPGSDGYVGTGDEAVGGTGYIGRVRVRGGIFGTGRADESYGVYAANNTPEVYHYWNQPFLVNGNAAVGSLASAAGPPAVVDVSVSYNSITIRFDHAINMETVDTDSFTIYASVDQFFIPVLDTNISETVANTITYDSGTYAVTFRLDSGTWDTLGFGSFYQLTLDSSVIADARGLLLDGEPTTLLPSGDHVQGGDFVFEYSYGPYTLADDVPAYEWWHGCSPTAAGMLVGYYDGLGYSNLIPGSAATQTDEVNEAIASTGGGDYEGNGGINTPGTLGQGHIPDYALYNGINDSQTDQIEPDMSDPAVVAAQGIEPHVDNCLADFMGTSRSFLGLRFGLTWSVNIGPGVEDYFEYKGYTADAELFQWGQFSWADYVNSISQGSPVLFGVDSGDSDGDATGVVNHSVIGIGYDLSTRSYAIYDTWDWSVHWYEFQNVNSQEAWGIGEAVFVDVA